MALTPITIGLNRDSGSGLLKSNLVEAVGSIVALANFTDGNLVPPSIYSGVTWNSFNDTRSIEAGQMRCDYPIDPSYPALAVYVRSLNVSEIFIDFFAKMPGNKGGVKFVKIFCVNDGDTQSYCNCTFGLDYTGATAFGKGTMCTISYGDGGINVPEGTEKTNNDTQNGVWLDRAVSPPGAGNVGRSWALGASVLTPKNSNFKASDWGTGLHRFKMRAKFNSGTTRGNEVNNGAFKLIIDGETYVDATNLFNSHPTNSKIIDRIEFFGYAQSNDAPFSLNMDDIRVSVGGFL